MKVLQHIISSLSLVVLFFLSQISFAQHAPQKTTRILFIVDGSSSMLEHWDGNLNRFKAGSLLIKDIMDSVTALNPNVEFGLRVFGHNYTVDKNNCLDTRMETSFAPYNSNLLFGKLSLLQPQGVSPIALALRESAEVDITQINKYAYSLILVTDGNESCGGDLCDVMQKLVNYKITFKPYIISLNNDKSLVEQYDCMGEFMIVSNKSDFNNVIKKILDDNNNFIANHSTKFTPQSSYNPSIINSTPTVDNTPKVPIQTSNSPSNANPRHIALHKNPFSSPRLTYSNNHFSVVRTRPINALPIFNLSIDTESPSTPTKEIVQPKKTFRQVTLQSLNGYKLQKLSQSMPKIAGQSRRLSPLPVFNLAIEEPIKTNPIQKITLVTSKVQALPIDRKPINISKIRITPLPTFNLIVEAPTPPPPTKTEPEKPQYISLTNEKIKPQDQKSTIKTEEKQDALAAGTMQIFITNGKGKYYNSSPKITIKNNNTGQTAFEGNRKISQGSPEQITLPDGKYTITFKESGRTVQVLVEKGKNKNVEVVVGNGNIAFVYTGTNEVPQGYMATISKRFEPGDIVNHPSEIKLEYDPSNYHIEINTLPILMYNVDIDADGLLLIDIPKPGKVQIINEEEIGRIEFWHILAGQSYRFHEMSIYGDIEYQQVELRPGKYEIRYPFITAEGEKVMKVKSFNLTSLEDLKFLLN